MKKLIVITLLAAPVAAWATGVLVQSRYMSGTTWACYYNVNGTIVSTTSNGPCPSTIN